MTSFAGMGEDDGDSNSGGVGGTIGEDNKGTDGNGNDSVVGSDDMPAGTVVVGREASEAEGGMAPRRSTEKEKKKKKKKTRV